MTACRVAYRLAKFPLRSTSFQNACVNSRHIVPIRRSTNGCDSGTCGTVLISSSRIRSSIH